MFPFDSGGETFLLTFHEYSQRRLYCGLLVSYVWWSLWTRHQANISASNNNNASFRVPHTFSGYLGLIDSIHTGLVYKLWLVCRMSPKQRLFYNKAKLTNLDCIQCTSMENSICTYRSIQLFNFGVDFFPLLLIIAFSIFVEDSYQVGQDAKT